MFYCQKLCGNVDFDIEEWSRQIKIADELGIEIDEPEPCVNQCEDCINIVLDIQNKNKHL